MSVTEEARFRCGFLCVCGSTAQCIIYHFWKQRNNEMHNHLVLPPIVLFKLIDRKMRNTITTRRDRKQFLTLMAKSSIIWMR
ncbi:hypothetical protein BRARA_I00884 [Brassica rapa]|uniref:Uncharacterized protein n=1 Tax=Brassica campestris TaxID=3711 RepID=A0A397Y235_BRACM|nr:hypothetical protein BRARA_I00884 [Brassica rapa]